MFDRRRLLRSGGAALATLTAGRLLAAVSAGFTHGIASGEPTAGSVLLWTRFVGTGAPVTLHAEIAEDASFRWIVGGGPATATPDSDWTARAVVAGLRPGRSYAYRFVAPDGSLSDVGRTATMPEGMPARFAMAVMCCANLPFGWFNSYGHAAADPTTDLVVHLGDYIYEYPRGTYPPLADVVPGRVIEPEGWANSLATYRARYASYRRDADLRALHAAKPWLAIWDDHEFADNARADGSLDQDAGRDGPWSARKAAAARAWKEWMPVSHGPQGLSEVGELATLIRLENRVTGRTLPPSVWSVRGKPGDEAANLATFREHEYFSTASRMLGPSQERWLDAALTAAARRSRFQVLVNSVPMGFCNLPDAAIGWRASGGEKAQDEVRFTLAAARAGIPFNDDNWNGFPAQRARVLRAAQRAGSRLIVLSGDSHNHWFYRLEQDGKPAGVELGVGSISSPGFERWFPDTDPHTIEQALIARNPELAWCDTSRRGYGRLVLSPDRARLEWLASAPTRNRSPTADVIHFEEI